MGNKFLGLDSINVLKQYIDEQIKENINDTRLITINAYTYEFNGKRPETPTGGAFDNITAKIIYPAGWNSLKSLIENTDAEELELTLSEGSIWMSVGIIDGDNKSEWSTPIKISGQNGVSVKFAYAYNPDAALNERSKSPQGVNSVNRIEYIWTKYGEDEWTGPTIWAMYSEDASDIYWRYTITNEEDENKQPIPPKKPSIGNEIWSNNIPTVNISAESP